MQSILTNLRGPAIISFLLIIPFMVMEVVNRRNFNEGFPIALFVFMWLLPTLFILSGLPIVRSMREIVFSRILFCSCSGSLLWT
jgi:hypothetical protein